MFEKLRGRSRDLLQRLRTTEQNLPTVHTTSFQPKAHPSEVLESETTRINTSARTRWTTFGLSRKERRTIEALIRKGKATRFQKWQLRNSPRNWPSNGGSNNPAFEGVV